MLEGYEGMGLNVKGVRAADRFYAALAGVSDPEGKRKAIGATFIDVFDHESGLLEGVKWLGQGTIYPDVIESVSATGGPSATIKSHHNVGGLPDYMKLSVVEPLRMLFKDEVRRVAARWGSTRSCSAGIHSRGRVSASASSVRSTRTTSGSSRMPTAFGSTSSEHGHYDRVWQAGTILLPVQSVGVMGDERTYEQAVALRAVSSTDGMTADWVDFPPCLPGRGLQRHHQQGPRHQPRGLRHFLQAPRHHRMGVIRACLRGAFCLLGLWSALAWAQPGERTHTVERKETAYSIAQHYGVDLNRLFELNRWAEGGIRKGDVLRIPGALPAATPDTPAVDPVVPVEVDSLPAAQDKDLEELSLDITLPEMPRARPVPPHWPGDTVRVAVLFAVLGGPGQSGPSGGASAGHRAGLRLWHPPRLGYRPVARHPCGGAVPRFWTGHGGGHAQCPRGSCL